MGKISLKFKRSESFYIRDGWLEKAINEINLMENEKENIFTKTRGIDILGIGSNMVKGLKHWLQSAEIINKECLLSDFGNCLVKYDPYLESTFSLFLIHYFIAKNVELNPVFNAIFNIQKKCFTKDEIVIYIKEYLEIIQNNEEYKKEEIKKKYIEDDLIVFIHSYYNDGIIENPEDNFICPLSSLRLLTRKENEYRLLRPAYSKLSCLIIYFALYMKYEKKPFIIEDAMKEDNSPFKIFNLDKNMFFQYLEELKRLNLLIINKTAGLNTIELKKDLSLNMLFDMYFGGDKNV